MPFCELGKFPGCGDCGGMRMGLTASNAAHSKHATRNALAALPILLKTPLRRARIAAPARAVYGHKKGALREKRALSGKSGLAE